MTFCRAAAAAVAFLLFPFAQPALAVGVGAYFEYANVFDAEVDMGFADVDYEEDHFAVGVTVDTNVAADRLFNYRLDAGYERINGDYGSVEDDGDGLMVDNSFGFGLVRRPELRLWVGPALRLTLDESDESDVLSFGIGGGPAIGVNLHATNSLSFSVSAGYQVLYVYASPDQGDDDDGYEQLAFVRLAFMIRTADDRFGD